ncbi:MAG: S-layer homology domain-containing protein [Eubacteriales bacterium]|nr:S-layer homology domain-containing protein [Eubacteriales bacterium]
MKRSLKILFLTLLLAAGLTGAAFASLRDVAVRLSPGLTYAESTEDAEGGYEQYYALEYTPGGATAPSLAAGDAVWGRHDPEELLAALPGTPVAAVNADFYTMTTGVPEGIQILDGELWCSDSWQNAVGILADGTFFIGRPELIMKLSGTSGEVKISYINKPRTAAGFYLYTSRYGGEEKLTGDGTNVVLRARTERMTVGVQIECTVVSVTQGEGLTAVPEGCFVLSCAADGPIASLPDYRAGDTLTLTVSCADSRWEQAVYACGAGELLVENGKARTGLSTARKACTALGIRADGSVVLLAGDGRVVGCVGSSLARMAEKLVSMGCVTAVNLDGGGSTTLLARWPGDTARGVMNDPSDGSVRPCANYIVFSNTAPATGVAASVHIRPALSYALPGAEIPLTVTAADANDHPVSASAASVSASAGSVRGSVFTAPASGDAVITATLGGAASGSAVVHVLTEVDALRVQAGGTNVTAVSVDPGDTLDFGAAAYYLGKSVYVSEQALAWTVSPEIGTIDAEGVFTASGARGLSGTVTVRCGERSASVTVTLGRLPTLLDGFETAPSSEAAVLVTDPLYVHNGHAAVTVSSEVLIEGEAAVIDLGRLAIPEGTKLFTLWVRGKGTVSLVCDTGETPTVPVKSDAWQFVRFSVPAGAKTVTGVRIQGVVTLDQLMAHPKAQASDVCLVTVVTGEPGGAFTATVLDGAGYIVRSQDITLTGDGRTLGFSYDPATGVLTADTAGVRRVTLVVRDAAGNLTRATAVRETQDGAEAFSDMDGHWASGSANALYRAGVISGIEKSGKLCFEPGASATREQAAVMLVRALGIDTSADPAALDFADADEISDWARDSVRALAALGIMRGTVRDGKTVFEPQSPVTRAEIATLLGRTLERGYAESPDAFTDGASIGVWARPYVAVMRAMGVLTGYGDGSFRPNASVTRAELAVMLDRLGYGR